MTRIIRLFLLALVGLLAALIVVSADARTKEKQPSAEELEKALSEVQCQGPRPRVAVYGFYATGKMAAFEG